MMARVSLSQSSNTSHSAQQFLLHTTQYRTPWWGNYRPSLQIPLQTFRPTRPMCRTSAGLLQLLLRLLSKLQTETDTRAGNLTVSNLAGVLLLEKHSR